MTAQNIGFLVVVFLTNIIQCVTGFAGTVLAMPFSVMLVGLDTARPVLNIMGIAASIGVIARYHKDVDKKELLTILSITLPGMLAGAFLKNALAGYGGVLVFKAKNDNLLEYYMKEFGAVQVGRYDPYRLVIWEDEAEEIISAYREE